MKKSFMLMPFELFNHQPGVLGESIRIFDYQLHLPNLEKDSQQRKDIERFRWFSQDYLGFDEEKNLVTDVRYSMIPIR
jgi:inner membrane protein